MTAPLATPPTGPLRPAEADLSMAAGRPAASSRRRLRVAELLGKEQEIEIEHGQAVYRLRLTALGKLILTK